jgi:hypothetical protein
MWRLLVLVAAGLLPAMPALGQESVASVSNNDLRADTEPQHTERPSCISLDVRFQLRPDRGVHVANVPVDSTLARIIMDGAGNVYWDEVTHKGKKSPGICTDKNHPYYILAWTDIASTIVVKRNVPTSEANTTLTGRVGDDRITATESSVTWQAMDVPLTDHSATVSIYVVDYAAGCVVFPPAFGTYKFDHDIDKAAKKAMADALQFLLRAGMQPAPKPIVCFKPETIGIDADYVSKQRSSPE